MGMIAKKKRKRFLYIKCGGYRVHIDITHTHKWICSDIPGLYICNCGEEGKWNRNIEKVEVYRNRDDYYLEDE